jgi:FMN phosphatase YigB (HAD superfamily)
MDIQAIFFDLGETLVTSPRRWLPGAQALLASLKQKGVRLGIISNTANLPSRQAILDILPTDFDINLFEPALVLFSSEAGIEKPRKEIFEKAVSLVGIPASQCLYCSEDIVETLVAQHVGMRSTRVQQPPPGSDLATSDLATLEQRISDYQSNIL